MIVYKMIDWTGLLNSCNIMHKCNYDVMIDVCHLVLQKDCVRFNLLCLLFALLTKTGGCIMLMVLVCDYRIVSCPVTNSQ